MSATVTTQKSSKTICVGCKLPHGLIMQMDRLIEDKASDGAVVRKYVPVGKEIKLNGANTSSVIGGYGITENVDAEFFDAWLAQKMEHAFIQQNLVFAMPTISGVQDRAKEQAAVKSGFEPLNPDKPAPGIERATP